MSDKVNLRRYKGDVYLFDNSTAKQKKPPYDRFLRIGEVLNLVGFSSRTLYRKINATKNPFPKQIKIGQMSLWSEISVLNWMEKQKNGGGV